MKKRILILTIVFLLFSCKPIIVKTEPDYIKENFPFTGITLPAETKIRTANVDYHDKNNSVFFSLTNDKTFVKPNDFWDIAISTDKDNADNDWIYVVSNSGDYGENARILPLKTGTQKEDYKDGGNDFNINKIQQVSFKNGITKLSPYQQDPDTGNAVANPVENSLTNGKKYFLKTGKTENTTKVYIIWFESITPGINTNFTLHVVPCIYNSIKQLTDFSTEYTVSGTISNDYSFNYIKLSNTSGKILKEADGIPKKADWELLFCRTNIYSKEMGEVFKNDGIIGTSSILTNSPAGVEVARLYGWDFPEVTHVPQQSIFVRMIDGVGKGYTNPLKTDIEQRRKAWYYGVNMPPTFYLNRITYVLKCTDGDYGKFRPGSFYGPNGENFYVRFRYIK